MATLRNKRKLAAVTRETQEEHPRNGQSRNTSVPRINEEYITQVSVEIEGRVTKRLSQEFSRTESRILGALSKLDEFLLNPQIRTHSGTVPATFRNTNVENQEPNEDRSQDDPHPEKGPSVCQSRHSIDSDTDKAPHSNYLQYQLYQKLINMSQHTIFFRFNWALITIRTLPMIFSDKNLFVLCLQTVFQFKWFVFEI